MTIVVRYVLFAFVFSLALFPEIVGFKSKSLPDMSFIRLLLLLLGLALTTGLLLSKPFATKSWVILKENSVAVSLIVLFFLWRFITSAMSPSGVGTIAAAIRDAMYFALPFFAVLLSIHSKKDIRKLILILSISAGLSVLVAVVEYTTGFSLFGSLTAADSAWNTFALKQDEFAGVLGTFPHPLAFGSYVVGVLILSSLFYADRLSAKYTLGASTFTIFCLLGIYVSTSRGAQASLTAAIGLAGILTAMVYYRKIKVKQKVAAFFVIVLPICAGALVVVLLVGSALIKGGSDKQENSSMMRVLQIELSVPVISSRPVLGYGVGHAAEVLAMKAETVDVYYLTIALESGLVGLFLFLLLLGYFLRQSIRLYLKTKQPYFLAMAMFFMSESVIFLVLSIKQAVPLLYIGFALFLVIKMNIEKRWDMDAQGRFRFNASFK